MVSGRAQDSAGFVLGFVALPVHCFHGRPEQAGSEKGLGEACTLPDPSSAPDKHQVPEQVCSSTISLLSLSRFLMITGLL